MPFDDALGYAFCRPKTHYDVVLVELLYHLKVTPKARSAAERETSRAFFKALWFSS
jgi:hypothetical protein